MRLSQDIKLSVVVLVYNTEQYLRDCLDSLVNQTLQGIEIITVNDESPDNSLFILEEYSENYPNIKVVNQTNSGGAVAGNNGVMQAKGKYVTIMDSDDIVPLDAYEKLYNKAINEDADIVIGKANILIDGVQKEILYKKERQVWEQERVINNVKDYLDIFYDGFYWNKIYKREFLIDNDCLMPPGMLYADRPMVHKAFLYASKIAIIKDIVYLWRKRGEEASQKSITQTNSDMKNFEDRLESYYYQLDYFNQKKDETLYNEFSKRNIDRFFFPIKGILESDNFKEKYFEEVGRIFKSINGVYDNDLGIIKNIYIYMIVNNLQEELVEFLQDDYKGSIVEEDGKFYWALKQFRSQELSIPDELFQLKKLLSQFIEIGELKLEKQKIHLSNLTFPKAFNIDRVKLEIRSRQNVNEIREYYLMESDNTFSTVIDQDDLDHTEAYDIYLVIRYNDKEDMYRITKKMLKDSNHIETTFVNDSYKLFFTKNGNLSFIGKFINVEKVLSTNDIIEIIPTKYPYDRSLEFFVQNRVTKEKIYFKTGENVFSLKWKHFMDPDSVYDLYYEIHEHKFRLSADSVRDLTEKVHQWVNVSGKLYLTDKNNISLDVKSSFKSTLGNLKRKIIRV